MSIDERGGSYATPSADDQFTDHADDGGFLFDPHPDELYPDDGTHGDFHPDQPGLPVYHGEPVELTGPLPIDPLAIDPVGTGRHSRQRANAAAPTAVLRSPTRRGVEKELRRKRRRRRTLLALVLVMLVVVGGAGWLGYQSFKPTKVADWTGTGTGAVTIQVHSGDGAGAIGTTLAKAGVVASAEAFTQAAAKNSKTADIAAGSYAMRLHMSGAAAVNLMLDPAAHLVAKLVIPEGTIEKDVITKLAAALKTSEATVSAAAADVANLGIPDGYAPASGPLTSAEGFLYPDTYALDPTDTPQVALQAMTSEFTTEDRAIGFADGAKKLGLTPYQELIIASIAQSEVKFDTDAGKVARVIMNRIAQSTPLRIDATSAYAAKLQGIDPTTIQYADIVSPYNTYLHSGLPPTPIGNPGDSVLKAVIAPPNGDWLFYVNGDAAGHLYFTDNEADFEKAVAQCKAQHWGCG